MSAWAEANGYTRHQVYMVINGQFKGRRGTSHEIALKLGIGSPSSSSPPKRVQPCLALNRRSSTST
ncbi:hypothetical protein P4131_17495 [Pseudomonas aeruginosa]|nr:hypothetical protein [Pseudomonas aeruginosa]